MGLTQEPPTSRIKRLAIRGGADVIIIEIKHTINVMCVNHPETTPAPNPTCGKTVFHETSPWCQKKWGTTDLTHATIGCEYRIGY